MRDLVTLNTIEELKIEQTWQGYSVRATENGKHFWLVRIHDKKPVWCPDYLYAHYYKTEKTARNAMEVCSAACTKTIKIKMYDDVTVTVDGETESVQNMPNLWKWLRWDIENDPSAKECADLITRELLCFGEADISALSQGRHTVVIRWVRNSEIRRDSESRPAEKAPV